MKKVDKLREKLIKRLRHHRVPAQQVAIELHDYDFQTRNFKPFENKSLTNE
jgi:hypothetical protein